MAIVRKARTGDAMAILRLERRVWRNEHVTGTYDIGPIIFHNWAFVAVEKGRIVGAILATGTREGSAYVNDWVVEPRLRGKGVGIALYRRLLRATGKRAVVTFVSPRFRASWALHAELDFRKVRRVRDPYGVGEKKERWLLRRG